MITQQQWDKFSTQTKYISQNFDRPKILEVVCKCGLEGGLSFFEIWPKGVNDYAYKMRFRKGNGNKGTIFVFNDFCINNEPLSALSVAYREYNASIFGKAYAIDAGEYLSEVLSKTCKKFDEEIRATEKLKAAFLNEFERDLKTLHKIADEKDGIVSREK